MMPRQDGRIEKGQSLRSAISAKAWNRAQDAADVVLGARTGLGEGTRPPANARKLVIAVKNMTAQTLPRLSVLAMGEPVNSPGTAPADSLDEIYDGTLPNAPPFIEYPVFQANVISNAAQEEKLCVLDEPLEPNGVGRAIIGGVFVCVVDVIDGNHGFATGKSGSTMELRTTTCGVVQLLWKSRSTPGRGWALAVM